MMRVALVAAVIANLAACAPPAPAVSTTSQPSTVPAGRHVILKLKTGVRMDESERARLARVAGAPLVMIREMSGDAWLFNLQASDPVEFQRALDRLRQDRAVEWAEPDAPVGVR